MSGSRRTASSPRKRPAGDRVPRTVLREICRLRLHRRARGRARRRVGRPRRMAGGARGVLARLQAAHRRGDGAAAVGDHRRARHVPRAAICSRPRPTAATRGCARIAATGGWRCAAASSARSSPAPTIPSANTPAASRSRAARTGGQRARDARQRSRDRPAGRAQDGAVRAVHPARRGQGRQARLDPQGHSRARPGMGAEAAEPAARRRRASGDRQADHRLDRPLWAVSGA